jgi:integrase
MPKRNPPGLSKDVDRHGNVRWYIRRAGKPKIRIPHDYGTPAFWIFYRDGMAGRIVPPGKPGPRPKAAPESWRGLCDRYFGSPEFRQLAPRTQTVRRAILETFCLTQSKTGAPYGVLPFALMEPRHIRAVRDAKAETPAAANGLVKALRQLYAFAIAADLATSNPAQGIPYLPSSRPGGIVPWTEQDVAAFEAKHPLGTMARLALILFTSTGQRISDVVRLGPNMVKDGVITFTQAKNAGRRPVDLSLPITPELAHALACTPHGETAWLVNEWGRPFASVTAFGNKFRDWCRAAGIDDKSPHGLRKYVSAKLADNGATDREIMAVTGHRTAKEVDRYTRSANQKRLAASGLAKANPIKIVPPKPESPESGTETLDKSLNINGIPEVLVPGGGAESRFQDNLLNPEWDKEKPYDLIEQFGAAFPPEGRTE